MPFIQTRAINIYFEQAGSGDPVLFISGTGGDLRAKPNVFDGPLSRAFHVTAYDQCGLGQSEKPDRAYSMAEYADDAANLLDALGIARCHIIGVSFGGMVAQELVLRHPSRVQRLVLACTSPGGAGGASFPFHDLTLVGEARARHMIPISDTRHDSVWAAVNPALYERMVAFAATDPFADEPGRAMGARRQLEARRHHDTWERLPAIKVPCLIAAGRYDGIALPETQERMAGQIGGARLAFFEGGHLFLIQDPQAWPSIIKFLSD